MDTLRMSQELQALLANTHDQTKQQLVRDFVLNTTSRSDVFAKSAQRDEALQQFKQYYCINLYDELPEKVMSHGNSYGLSGTLYQQIHTLCKENTCTVADILNHQSLKENSQAILVNALKILFALNILAPSTQENQAIEAAFHSTINAKMLPLCVKEQMRLVPLMSPALGNAVMLSLDQAWLLSAMIEHNFDEATVKKQFIKVFEQFRQQLPQLQLKEGANIDEALTHSMLQFKQHSLPLLQRLAIINL